MSRKRQPEPEYVEALNEVIDAIYFEADRKGLDWVTLARKSGLSYSTVWKIGYRFTIFPEYRTVLALARAVGMTQSVLRVAR